MTQNYRVWKHLESGKGITAMEAITLYGIMRLAAVIEALRKNGKNIVDEMVSEPKPDGTVAKVKRYRMGAPRSDDDLLGMFASF